MLIGLYGPSRAGKDTVAGILVKKFGFEQRNLASPIRHVLLKLDPMVWDSDLNVWFTLSSQVEEFGWDFVKAEYPESVEMMITLGQEMRNIDENIWLNACTDHAFGDLVIADVRQVNEYEYIWDNGGEVWKIDSDRKATQVRGMDGLLEDKYFPVLIHNNGTIEELEEMVATVMEARK